MLHQTPAVKGPKLFPCSGVRPFEGRICLGLRLVPRRLCELALVGVTFAIQLGQKALPMLLALKGTPVQGFR